MVRIELEFYTVQEKEPPFNVDLLCNLNKGGFVILQYIDDSEYGKLFSGYEGYIMIEGIFMYATLEIIKITSDEDNI